MHPDQIEQAQRLILENRREAIRFYASGQSGPLGLSYCDKATALELMLLAEGVRPASSDIDWEKEKGDIREEMGLPREEPRALDSVDMPDFTPEDIERIRKGSWSKIKPQKLKPIKDGLF